MSARELRHDAQRCNKRPNHDAVRLTQVASRIASVSTAQLKRGGASRDMLQSPRPAAAAALRLRNRAPV